MKFDLPKEQTSIIKVIGVGGGGSNAVNHMYNQGIKGVDFIVCNTDQQALDISPVPIKVQLGASLTEGRGAGSIPEIGKNAAIENIEDLKSVLAKNTKMIFITAGMGGGTGTGAAPVIAKAAREMGILTVGIVTIPFSFEGKKRKTLASEGIEELRKNVDTMLVISNDRLREMYGNLSVNESFAQANNVLTTAAKGIAEIITVTGTINVDFNDVHTVMKNGGAAIMGAAKAEGENRAIKAAEQALHSPLLNDNNIKGASQVLLYITNGTSEATMDEVGEVSDYIQAAAGDTANIIMGIGTDESLGENIRVIIIATGFNTKTELGYEVYKKPERIVKPLMDEIKNTETTLQSIQSPVVNEQPVTKGEYKDSVIDNLEPFLITKNNPASEEKQSAIEFEIINTLKQEPVNNIPVAITPAIPPPVEKEKVISPEPVPVNSIKEEPKLITPLPTPAPTEPSVAKKEEKIVIDNIQPDEQIKKAHERIMKLKELSLKLKTPNGLSELENEPAYKRRNVTLNSIPGSAESQVSRYTLSEGEDKKVEIKPNNSFLHDNVD